MITPRNSPQDMTKMAVNAAIMSGLSTEPSRKSRVILGTEMRTKKALSVVRREVSDVVLLVLCRRVMRGLGAMRVTSEVMLARASEVMFAAGVAIWGV